MARRPQQRKPSAPLAGWPGPDPDQVPGSSPPTPASPAAGRQGGRRFGRWRNLLGRVFASASVRQERRELLSRVEVVDRRLALLDAATHRQAEQEALRLAEVRERIAQLTGTPDACASCASRLPAATPEFPGGYCCGGGTTGVTPPDELIPLRLAGTRLDRQRLTTNHRGCIYRDPTGCTLTARDRPTICVAYMCSELRAELHHRGTLPEIVLLGDELTRGQARIGQAFGSQGPDAPAKVPRRVLP